MLNFKFKILTNPCAQSLKKSLVLGPNVSSQICNKLLPTWSSLSTSATVTTSTSFELASSHARVTSIKFTKRHGVSQWASEWVSEWVSDKHSQWSDSGPIKTFIDRIGFWVNRMVFMEEFENLSNKAYPRKIATTTKAAITPRVTFACDKKFQRFILRMFCFTA